MSLRPCHKQQRVGNTHYSVHFTVQSPHTVSPVLWMVGTFSILAHSQHIGVEEKFKILHTFRHISFTHFKNLIAFNTPIAYSYWNPILIHIFAKELTIVSPVNTKFTNKNAFLVRHLSQSNSIHSIRSNSVFDCTVDRAQ